MGAINTAHTAKSAVTVKNRAACDRMPEFSAEMVAVPRRPSCTARNPRTCSTPHGDLARQPLKVLGQVRVFISVGNHFNPFVQHVLTELLKFVHVSPPYEHEVLQV